MIYAEYYNGVSLMISNVSIKDALVFKEWIHNHLVDFDYVSQHHEFRTDTGKIAIVVTFTDHVNLVNNESKVLSFWQSRDHEYQCVKHHN